MASKEGRRGPRRARSGEGPWRAPSWRRWALLAAALLLVTVGLWLALSWRRPPRPPVVAPRGTAGETPSAQRRQRPARPADRANRRGLSVPAGELALVIDDLGRSVEEVAVFDDLEVPLSYSVLPYEERTAEVVARLRSERREILCHLPMQPANGHDPGPGALREGMGLDALAAATRNALARVPGAVGANNHMGSGLTA